MYSVLRRLWFLLRRDRMSRELEEEMRLHLELRAASLEQSGMTLREARLAARRRFGRTTSLQERSRDMWGLEWLDRLRQDLRYAARRLWIRPGFSVPIIAVLALGIGATTAVFSAVDAALFRPLPFAKPNELVTLTNVAVPFIEERDEQFPVDLQDVAAMRDVFSNVAAFAAGGLNLTSGDRPLRARAGVVSAGFFETLGVPPYAGRTFSVEEGRPNGARVALLSFALWQQHFGASSVIGSTIQLNRTPYTVIGVMPPRFSFPNESDLWIPLSVPTTMETFAPFRGWLPSRVVARLAPRVSTATASARLWAAWQQAVAPQAGTIRPHAYDSELQELRERGVVIDLQRELVGSRRTALLVLFGATGLLLLIVCANVANLLLSDAAVRRREVAVREVLGATRLRVVRQLLAESLLLAGVGATLGILLAPTVLGVLRAVLPTDLAGVAPARLDLRVLLFAVLVSVITALAFGLWPTLTTTRTNPNEIIKAGGGHGATAGGLGRARRVLVVAELALSVMLLIGAGLMLRSFEHVVSQDLGMRANRVATLEMSLKRGAGGPRAERLRIIHAIVDRLAATPGIDAAGAVNDLPLRASGGIALRVEADGMPAPSDDPNDPIRYARYLMASGGYFSALGIPLLRGRTFTAADDSLAPKVAIINKMMADKLWPGVDPVGRTFHLSSESPPITVVGIVADVREAGLEKPVAPQLYFPIEAETPDNVAIVARGTLPSNVMLARLAEAVRAADRSQPVFNVRMMDDVVATSLAPRRTNTVLIALFAALALVLSALGVYAVVARGVAQRWRELGIRAALGATGRDLVAHVSGEIAVLGAIGVAIGLGGAWALARLIASLLYGVGVHDPATFVAVPLILVVPAAIAALVPALRAVRVSPTEVMRAE
jgi:putative ABC transport system permease protein